MKDIAVRVGVSVKSVSRVVNGEGGVSPATAERILDVAEELGFRRNDLARNLRRRDRTGTIGLVLKHSSTRFYDQLIQGVEDVAERHGTLVITAGSRSPERERDTLLALSSRRVDGLLIVPTGTADHAFLAAEQATGMPLVFVDRPPRHLTADTILADDHGGARAAVDHLVRHGHRRIAVIGAGADLHTVRERVRGYRAALGAAGIEPDERLVQLDREGRGAAERAVTELLATAAPPTALFTTNNVSTIGATTALRRAGAEHRVALVGFDDFVLADLLDPPLTVVAHDITEMGRRAAQRLFRRIDDDRSPARTDVLPTRLIPRGSGEIAAVLDQRGGMATPTMRSSGTTPSATASARPK
jgi:LacI family transcriptional regulator